MPQSPARAQASESIATEEVITPNREGRPDTLGLVSSPPEDRVAPTSQPPEPGDASDADAVVAVKVLWLFFCLSYENHGLSALYSAVEDVITVVVQSTHHVQIQLDPFIVLATAFWDGQFTIYVGVDVVF